jgi:hypothetical protein
LGHEVSLRVACDPMSIYYRCHSPTGRSVYCRLAVQTALWRRGTCTDDKIQQQSLTESQIRLTSGIISQYNLICTTNCADLGASSASAYRCHSPTGRSVYCRLAVQTALWRRGTCTDDKIPHFPLQLATIINRVSDSSHFWHHQSI